MASNKKLPAGGGREQGSLHNNPARDTPSLRILPNEHPPGCSHQRALGRGSVKPIHLMKLGENFPPCRHSPVFKRNHGDLDAQVPRFLPTPKKMRKTPPLRLSQLHRRGRNLLQSLENRQICLWVDHLDLLAFVVSPNAAISRIGTDSLHRERANAAGGRHQRILPCAVAPLQPMVHPCRLKRMRKRVSGFSTQSSLRGLRKLICQSRSNLLESIALHTFRLIQPKRTAIWVFAMTAQSGSFRLAAPKEQC